MGSQGAFVNGIFISLSILSGARNSVQIVIYGELPSSIHRILCDRHIWTSFRVSEAKMTVENHRILVRY